METARLASLSVYYIVMVYYASGGLLAGYLFIGEHSVKNGIVSNTLC